MPKRFPRMRRMIVWIARSACVLIVMTWFVGLFFNAAAVINFDDKNAEQIVFSEWHFNSGHAFVLIDCKDELANIRHVRVPRLSLSYDPIWRLPANEMIVRLGFVLPKNLSGLMGSTYFYVIPIWLLLAVPGLPLLIRFFIRRRAPSRGHCEKCDYDLTGNISGICPECGAVAIVRS